MTGLSKSRLERLHHVLAAHVERRDLPGLVALVSCRDDVHVETLGTLALDNPAPMQRDSIFRIASLSKPITAVAAMMLIEDCRIRLDDSIERWIPELANRHVLRTMASELDDTVPARRAITLRDLLTFRMGFGSVMAMPGTHPMQDAVREHRIGGDGPPLPASGPTTEQWIASLGSLPLMAQPGDRWMYNTSADVLGVLVARVSGQAFGEFLQSRIFEPLGMTDTSFHAPAGKLERFSTSYRFDRTAGALAVFDRAAGSSWGAPPPFESGAGGLVSTLDDYFAFSRTMLNMGRHGSEQLLSRASVELMTTDQLTPGQREGAEAFFGDHATWGLGLAVDIARREIYHSPGRYGWTGGLGTTAYNDPANGLIGILFTQRMMDSPAPPQVMTDFWTLAYQAME
ncbi:MAG: beta-lactamase [Gemmatimonadetes bacterium]|nr:beta-lactamase [Gemmatimonadota bacterium]